MIFNNTRTFAWKLCFRGYFTMKNENLHHFSEIIIILFILFYVYIYIIIIITKGIKKKKYQLNHRPQRYITSPGRIIMRFFINLLPRRRRGGMLAGTAAVTTTSPCSALATPPTLMQNQQVYCIIFYPPN